MAVNWDYFDRFEKVVEKYLPSCGEGETVATQIVTAVNKIIYKWYNDGDVYDNTGILDGWCNDLSSYANWLVKYTGRANLLYDIFYIGTESEYEDILKELAETFLDEEYLAEMNTPKQGSIYDCEGKFKFEEYGFDEDEEY